MGFQVSRFVCAAAVVLVLAQPVQASKEIDAAWVWSLTCEELQKQGTLDGRAEMAKALAAARPGTRQAVSDAAWEAQACLLTLLKYRRFDEFVLAWAAAGQLRDRIRGSVLFSIGAVALVHTDGRCARCEVHYDDDMLYEAAAILLEDYDPAADLERAAERAGFSEPRPSTVPSTVDDVISSFYRSTLSKPCCGTRKNFIRIMNVLLNRKIRFTFLDEKPQFMDIMSLSSFMDLGDEALMERLFASGASIERGKWKYLVGRAPTMAMVRLLERHGYVLSRKEYKEVVKSIKSRSQAYQGEVEAEPDVLAYFQNKAR